MKEREALKLALEALEWNLPVIEDHGVPNQLKMQHKAITSIYEALAQPEQERCEYCKRGLKTMCLCGMKAQPEQEPCRHRIADVRNEAIKSGYMCMDCGALFGAYTTPPQRTWVGLTSVDWNDFNAVKGNDPHYVAQWAEAKLKEKNT